MVAGTGTHTSSLRRRIARGEADSMIGQAGAQLPGGAVELPEVEDRRVAPALCAEIRAAREQGEARPVHASCMSQESFGREGYFPGRDTP